MSNKRLSRWNTIVDVRLVAAAAIGAACFALILGTAFVLAGSTLLGQVSDEWIPPEYQEKQNDAQQRKDAERSISDYKKQYQNREKELKQNFKGIKIDPSAVQASMAKWKEGINNLEQALSSGTVQDYWDVNSDFYYDYQQPVDDAFSALYSQQSYLNLERQFKDNERQLKNMKSDVKRLQKDLKGTPAIDTLDAFVKDYEANLSTLKSQYASLDRNDNNAINDFQSEINEKLSTQDFYDTMQELNDTANAAQTKKEAQRRVKEIGRSIKDQERNAKKLKDTELDLILASRKSLLSQIEQLLKQERFDADAYRDLETELNDLDQQGWEIISVLNEKKNEAEQERNAKRTIKDKERTIKDMERECKRARCQGTPADALRNEFKKIVEHMKASAVQKDYESFWDLNSEADSVGSDFWPLANEDEEEGGGLGPEELDQILNDIGVGEKNISDALLKGTTTKDIASSCRKLLSQAHDIVVKIKNTGNDEFGEKLNEIGNQIDGGPCGGFLPPED